MASRGVDVDDGVVEPMRPQRDVSRIKNRHGMLKLRKMISPDLAQVRKTHGNKKTKDLRVANKEVPGSH
jgi:hypothetical protein